MKKFALIAALLLCSCSSGSINLFPQSWRGGQGEGSHPRDTSSRQADTSIFLSAISLPEKGIPKLVLFRNYTRILELDCTEDAFVSADPDLHHIVKGKLCTQFSTADSTFVKVNGEIAARFEGREYIRGILPMGDDIYTLGISKKGTGFALRKNGNAVFLGQEGSVDGGFSDKDFDGCGALFADAGRVCFRYRSGEDLYLVIDGRIANSEAALREKHFASEIRGNKVYFPADSGVSRISYWGGILLYKGAIVQEDCMFFPPHGGFLLDGTYHLALSSKKREWKPYVWEMETRREIDGVDVITGIAVEITPASR